MNIVSISIYNNNNNKCDDDDDWINFCLSVILFVFYVRSTRKIRFDEMTENLYFMSGGDITLEK